MSEDAVFWVALFAIIWIGWPLWQLATDIRAMKDKALRL